MTVRPGTARRTEKQRFWQMRGRSRRDAFPSADQTMEREVMPTTLSKANMEKTIGEAVCTFWKDFLGWNPAEVQVFLAPDQIIVSLRGTLAPAEQKLAATSQGRMRMKQMRSALLDQCRDGLLQAIATSTQATVFRTLTSIDVSANEERFIVVFAADEVKTLAPKDD